MGEKTREEINRLFNLFRIAALNVKYYGARSADQDKTNARFQMAAALLGSAAFIGLVTKAFGPYGSVVAQVCSVLTVAVSYYQIHYKLADKAKKLEVAHASYAELFGQCEALLLEIRRSPEITEEQLGKSVILHDRLARLASLDEKTEKTELKDRFTAEVNKSFPPQYVWQNM